MNNIMIKNINPDERPRERLIKYGKESLSNEELISIIIRCGTKNISVKNVSLSILSNFKSVRDLRNININKLSSIKGIGEVKAITLIAALELGKRVYYEKRVSNNKINNTKDIYKLLGPSLVYEMQENFYVILLDVKNNIICYKKMFVGTINKSIVHPREIFKYAIDNLAVSIIIVHNHPSGDTSPSNEDIYITNNIAKIGEIIGIKLLDHVIMSKYGFYSFYENNKNKNK